MTIQEMQARQDTLRRARKWRTPSFGPIPERHLKAFFWLDREIARYGRLIREANARLGGNENPSATPGGWGTW